MKQIEKIWISAGVIVAGLALFFVFGASNRIHEAREKEHNMILQTDPSAQARADAKDGTLKIFKVWREKRN
ncbi:MAG: hypothetical protein EA353_14310 [Puniceicoccaceae bacterium]|nr:MAG: hypothetical protein EA353_14310 [Puniceicoccaceae bacterium]